MRHRTRVRLLALLLTVALVLPAGARGQALADGPAVTETFVSTFNATPPPPAGPLDQILQVVNLEPGASTPIHSHDGPGFATILQGQVMHHRVALGSDTRYGTGDTWVEIPHDVHFAHDVALTPATILATFILPREAVASNPTAEQPDPVPPPPTVPAAARVPITTAAATYEVRQLLRSYEPGASMTSAPGEGSQGVVLLIEGQLTVTSGQDVRTYVAGESWVETGSAVTTSWNPTSSISSAVVSILSALP
jgi:quercetin dioxygenase-like cupin family protein